MGIPASAETFVQLSDSDVVSNASESFSNTTEARFGARVGGCSTLPHLDVLLARVVLSLPCFAELEARIPGSPRSVPQLESEMAEKLAVRDS